MIYKIVTIRKMLLSVMITIVCGTNVYALEIENNYRTSVVSQVAMYALEQIVASTYHNSSNILIASQKIASKSNLDDIVAKLKEVRSHIRLLEKDSVDKFTLSIVEPPIILTSNVDLEMTVLVFFAATGKNIKSGMMTFKMISPTESAGKISCGFILGHVCFSTSNIIR